MSRYQLRLGGNGPEPRGTRLVGDVLTFTGETTPPEWQTPVVPPPAGDLCSAQLTATVTPDVGQVLVAVPVGGTAIVGAPDGRYFAKLIVALFDSIYQRPFSVEYLGAQDVVGGVLQNASAGPWRLQTNNADWTPENPSQGTSDGVVDITVAGLTWQALGVARVCLLEPITNPNPP